MHQRMMHHNVNANGMVADCGSSAIAYSKMVSASGGTAVFRVQPDRVGGTLQEMSSNLDGLN